MKNTDNDYLRSKILPIFNALVLIKNMGLPKDFDNIETVNIYQIDVNNPADNWESYLRKQEQAWIITPLHYYNGGRRVVRKTSCDRRWDARKGKKDKRPDNSCYKEEVYHLEEKHKMQAANGVKRINKYTMHEYSPKGDTPQYALCKISLNKEEDEQEMRQPQKFLLQKRQKTDDGYIRKFEKGETSCSGDQRRQQGLTNGYPLFSGADTEYSTGPYRKEYKWANLRIDAKIYHELAQYYQESYIEKMVEFFLHQQLLCASANSIEYATSKDDSSGSKYRKPAPMNNDFNRCCSSTSNEEGCFNVNRPHLFTPTKIQTQSTNLEMMVDINTYQNDGGLNEVLAKFGHEAFKPRETNTNALEQNVLKAISVQPASAVMAAFTDYATSTAHQNGGQYNLVTNFPINNAHPNIPEVSRPGEMNQSTLEHSSLRYISSQPAGAGMAVFPDDFTSTTQNIGGGSSSMMCSPGGDDHNHDASLPSGNEEWLYILELAYGTNFPSKL